MKYPSAEKFDKLVMLAESMMVAALQPFLQQSRPIFISRGK
jgi:hypothetical protein